MGLNTQKADFESFNDNLTLDQLGELAELTVQRMETISPDQEQRQKEKLDSFFERQKKAIEQECAKSQ